MHQVIFANLVTLSSGATSATSQPQALDPWVLIKHASPVVMLVLITLALMSVVCWFVIGAKLVRLSQASRGSARFLDQFWHPEHGNVWTVQRLEALYAAIPREGRPPVAAVFHAGYVELARVLGGSDESSKSQRHYGGDIENVARALRRAAANEVTMLESMVPFLATTGSTAPFVGLFGTVWGIMGSFLSIGAQKSASLQVVAPGIAEALIATAIGLIAAIPAVMAYNYFIRRINVLASEMENFSSDYLNIVRRHFLAG
jgi:biopolymer transport protein TolQ